MSSNEPRVPKNHSYSSNGMPSIAVGSEGVGAPAVSGNETQKVTRVQTISLPISSKRLEITGLVPGQIIEIRPNKENASTPPWVPDLSSTISVSVGGCIAAAASWWSSRNQARIAVKTAVKTIAAQNLREEIKALQDGIVAVESLAISAQISAPGEYFYCFYQRAKRYVQSRICWIAI